MADGKDEVPAYGIPAEPNPLDWGDGDALVDPDTGDFDRVNDWDWTALDVWHPGYDTQEEADADAAARAARLAGS